MDAALERCFRAIPLTSFEDLRPTSGALALLCYKSDCVDCKAYSQDGRAAFEETLAVDRVVPFNCDTSHHRDLAMGVGVNKLPAYVLVPHRGEVRMIRPD